MMAAFFKGPEVMERPWRGRLIIGLAVLLLFGGTGPGLPACGAEIQHLALAEVMALTEEEVQGDRLIATRGILTYYEPGHRIAFLQQGTSGMYLQITSDLDLTAGDEVEVTGILDPGLNGRNLRNPHLPGGPWVRRLGQGRFPDPRVLEGFDGVQKKVGACWSLVEVQVRQVLAEGDRARLVLEDYPEMPVYLAGLQNPSRVPSYLSGFRVRLHGVLADSPLSLNPLVMQRQFLIPRLEDIHIPPDERQRAFQVPEENLYGLRWLAQRSLPGARTKVTGTVTSLKPGAGFFIERGDAAVWMQCHEPQLPTLGQAVVCSGGPSSYLGAGTVRDAIWMPSAETLQPIVPRAVSVQQMAQPAWQGRLVQAQGRVVEALRSPDHDVIFLKMEDQVVIAHLPSLSAAPPVPLPEKASFVALSGVCLNRPSPASEYGHAADSIHLHLRSPGDLTLVQPPPFWTPRRLTLTLGGVLAASLLAAGWVVALRRKVKRQAEMIRVSVERQAIHEERVRIARDWHDMFEQHFSGLTMLLDATATTLSGEAAGRPMLEQAARMADHSRSEARKAIWDLRSPGRPDGLPFAGELQEALRHAFPEDLAVRLVIDCPEKELVLPRPVSQHLLRIALEAFTNAVKHSHGTRVDVTWSRQTEPEGVVLSVRDDGCGLAPPPFPAAQSQIHFGLLGMRERALRIRAVLELISPCDPSGAGTEVRVFLPHPFPAS
jgi:signal transduction histidine kinase